MYYCIIVLFHPKQNQEGGSFLLPPIATNSPRHPQFFDDIPSRTSKNCLLFLMVYVPGSGAGVSYVSAR